MEKLCEKGEMVPKTRMGGFFFASRVGKVNPLALQITKQSKLKWQDARVASGDAFSLLESSREKYLRPEGKNVRRKMFQGKIFDDNMSKREILKGSGGRGEGGVISAYECLARNV